jgi:hypothetical protein
MAESHIPEGIVRFTQALVEDASLRLWFLNLDEYSTAVRQRALRRMAREMEAGGEDPALARAVAALTHPELFDAVRKSVRDRCGV